LAQGTLLVVLESSVDRNKWAFYSLEVKIENYWK